MQQWTVFLWKSPNSPGADICEQVSAEDAEEAAFAVMARHGLTYACYIWVVSETSEDTGEFDHLVRNVSGARAHWEE